MGCDVGKNLYNNSVEWGPRNNAVRSAGKAKKGALRMNLCVRLLRGLRLSGWVLGGMLVLASVASVATVDFAVAQTASSIVVQGNRRVEADTIRSYFRVAPGQRLCRQDRRGV